jgi:hypothetical protein
MQFKQINREETRAIREIVMRAMREALKDSNLEITEERGSFGGTNCSLKFLFAIKGDHGLVETREASDFRRFCAMYQLEPGDLGREFTSGGERFQVTGLNTKAPRFPIQCKHVANGRPIRYSAATVRQLLRVEAAK